MQSARAAAERDFALRQLARAESVNDMNAFLLSDAAPHGTGVHGRRPAEPRRSSSSTGIRSTRRTRPRWRRSISIGRQYWSQDEDDNARRALTRAFDLSRALPATSASTRGKAACALASALARGDEVPRAITLVRDGLAEIPPGRPFVLDRVFCELRASEVARESGDGGADVEHTQSADRLLRESGLGSELANLNVALHLAESFRAAGRNTEASAAFESAFAQLAAMGRDRTEMAGTLLNNWGLSRYLLGQPREAERLFRRAVEIGSADQAGASVSPMLLNNLARPVLEQGRVAEALAIAEQAAAEATGSATTCRVVQSMLLRATAYREHGDLARAGATVGRVRAAADRPTPADATSPSRRWRPNGRCSTRLAAISAAAATAADRAVAIAEASSQGRELLARGLLRRANLGAGPGPSRRGDWSMRRGAWRWRSRGAKPGRCRASSAGPICTMGRVFQAAARPVEARESLSEAVRHLEFSLGADHRDTLAARSILAALE